MADLNIIAGSVAPITIAGTGIIPTVTARGIAGATVAPGQPVYADPSAGNLIKPAQGSDAMHAANAVGIALDGAGLNQPVTYATGGDISLPTSGAGSQLLSGSAYVISAANAGAIAPSTDLAAGNFVTLLGVGNGTASGATSILRLGIIPAAVQR